LSHARTRGKSGSASASLPGVGRSTTTLSR
jgi:hypothetical protein